MTRIRWTTNAATDFTDIVERIRAESPDTALHVARTIYDGIAVLQTSPNQGRIGLAENTRELVFAPWPYIVVYEIIEDQVQVLRIRHTSRNWP
ncbi:MAG: type II toxin-antitoxin system RelE/ParE family toxin [Candidatus Korobacteraceae bacterium]